MSQVVTVSSPRRFDLAAFERVLPKRRPIPGEEHGSFDAFRDGLMASLSPMTPYECTIAENLVTIEWDIIQLRRAQDRRVTREIMDAIAQACVAFRRRLYEQKLDADYEQFRRRGGAAHDWAEPLGFCEDDARQEGVEIARRAMSNDPHTKSQAIEQVADMGLDLYDAISAAYENEVAGQAGGPIAILEQRRRHVMRDYEALQMRRPIDAGHLDA